MVTDVPTGPTLGDIPEMVDWPSSVNCAALLVTPYLVMVMGPLLIPEVTVNLTVASSQLLALMAAPLSLIWTGSVNVPKPEPLTLIVPFTPAEGGDKAVITGLGTAKTMFVLLGTAFTATVTGPVGAE